MMIIIRTNSAKRERMFLWLQIFLWNTSNNNNNDNEKASSEKKERFLLFLLLVVLFLNLFWFCQLIIFDDETRKNKTIKDCLSFDFQKRKID